MSIDIPQEPTHHEPKELTQRRQQIRLWLISLIQNRAYSLPQRFDLLHDGITVLDRVLSHQDWEQLDTLISGRKPLPQPEAFPKGPSSLRSGIGHGKPILEFIVKHSESIRPYGESIFEYFDDGGDVEQHHAWAAEQFETLMPQWEVWFENLLVNHMFFTQFPFQDPPFPLEGEFMGLCGEYILLRFLCLGRAAQTNSVQEIVDAAAAAFRLIDHTDFTRYAANLLYQAGCNDKEHMRQLVCL